MFVYLLASRYLYTRCGTFALCCYTHYIRSIRTGTFNITANIILHQQGKRPKVHAKQKGFKNFFTLVILNWPFWSNLWPFLKMSASKAYIFSKEIHIWKQNSNATFKRLEPPCVSACLLKQSDVQYQELYYFRLFPFVFQDIAAKHSSTRYTAQWNFVSLS